MKKFRVLSLTLAVVAFIGLYACNTSTKEVKEVEKEVVVEEAPVADSVAIESEVTDSTAVEETEAAVTEEAEPASEE